MDDSGRMKGLQGGLRRNRLDILLVTHLPNIRYLCGFTGSAGVLAVVEDNAVFFTDGRYKQQAREEVKGARVVVAGKNPQQAAAEWLVENRRKRSTKLVVGVESEHLTVAERARLARFLGSNFRLREAPPLIERARMIKDADEIARIKAAAILGASLFDRALQVIHPGVSEAEVAGEMEFAARRAGAEAMSFPTIIASGKRSALPHGRASQDIVRSGQFVVCDFGVILTGYCSDRTRTVYIGRPSSEARLLYESVKEAQLAAVDAVKPGVAVAAVDRAARNMLRRKHLARYFTHSTGHGVGLEIHEAPRIAAGQKDELQPGMVITIEPGAYIPGRWGVRIEDMVVVTQRGCEVIAPASTELITV